MQTGQTALTGRRGAPDLSLTSGFGGPRRARADGGRACRPQPGFADVARVLRLGLATPTCPGSSGAARLRAPERAVRRRRRWCSPRSEDKIHRGAYVASPTMPWAWGTLDPSGRTTWSGRATLPGATALIADGDRAGGEPGADFLFRAQQKADGSFPQNSDVAGARWDELQLDEVARPDRAGLPARAPTGALRVPHVKAAADFIVGFHRTGRPDAEGALGEPERLLAGHDRQRDRRPGLRGRLTRANGDHASRRPLPAHRRRLAAHPEGLDRHHARPVLAGPYFLRVTKDGSPDGARPTTSATVARHGGPAQRRRPELPGTRAPRGVARGDRVVRNSLGSSTTSCPRHRARQVLAPRLLRRLRRDHAPASPWDRFGDDRARPTIGPVAAARRRARRVRDRRGPAGGRRAGGDGRAANTGQHAARAGLGAGRRAASRHGRQGDPVATPLAWSHAQYVRLAWSIEAGHRSSTRRSSRRATRAADPMREGTALA